MKNWLGSLLLLWCSGSFAIGPNPSHDWRSFDTAHFVVHYEANNRPQAEAAAAIAETALPKITAALQWQPRDKTQLVLMDDYDVANGFATPLPFNHTGIFLTPPDDGELLENSDWLELVITHELTHIVHMDKVRGAPKFLQKIFGRFPFLFPNIWQPTWLIEGLAVYVESDPAEHRGRLDNTLFDAYMRLEVQHGVKSLREINSNGRAFPINKAYLYGAYFYRFLHERYGAPAVFKTVHDYSDNFVPFRVHSNPAAATGKPMDLLWLEFQDWLRQRFAAPATTAGGQQLSATFWQLDAPVLARDGSVYAVSDDGVHRPAVQRWQTGSEPVALLDVQGGARVDVNGRGELLIAQPEICDNYHYYYDLYRWSEADGKTRLTHCGRFRFAAWQGDDAIIALHNASGRAVVQQLDGNGALQRTLYQAQDDEVIPALAVAPNGTQLVYVSKRVGQWQLRELTIATGEQRMLWQANTALLSPRYSHDGTHLLFAHDGNDVLNAWRLSLADLRAERLTDSNGAVLAVSSSDSAQFVALELVADGYQLRRYPLTPVTETLTNDDSFATAEATTAMVTKTTTTTATTTTTTTAAATTTVVNAASVAPAVTISDERDYSAWETLAPRAWFPTGFSGDGALALGAEVFGQDALGWHQYALAPQIEISQGELLGYANYGYDQRHFLSVFREMEVLAYHGDEGDEEIDAYTVETTAQWLSLLPWLRLDHRVLVGVGAASAREVYQLVDGDAVELKDESIAALFVSYDSRRGNWWAEGSNSGQLLSLLAESYEPFDGQYEGNVYRADWRGQFALGRSTLALRLTEARGEPGTEPFELGGSNNSEHFGIPRLNERDLALRGYENGIPELTGIRARIGGIEWRTPLVDLDRHLMVPPIGINRLSAAVFYEAGSAWGDVSKPERYYRSGGVELLTELKLGYRLGLLLRAGFARGLDEPGGDEFYLELGRSF